MPTSSLTTGPCSPSFFAVLCLSPCPRTLLMAQHRWPVYPDRASDGEHLWPAQARGPAAPHCRHCARPPRPGDRWGSMGIDHNAGSRYSATTRQRAFVPSCRVGSRSSLNDVCWNAKQYVLLNPGLDLILCGNPCASMRDLPKNRKTTWPSG